MSCFCIVGVDVSLSSPSFSRIMARLFCFSWRGKFRLLFYVLVLSRRGISAWCVIYLASAFPSLFLEYVISLLSCRFCPFSGQNVNMGPMLLKLKGTMPACAILPICALFFFSMTTARCTNCKFGLYHIFLLPICCPLFIHFLRLCHLHRCLVSACPVLGRSATWALCC